MTIKLSRNKNICTWETAGGDVTDLIVGQINEQSVSGERQIGRTDGRYGVVSHCHTNEIRVLRQSAGYGRELVSTQVQTINRGGRWGVGDDCPNRRVV